MTCRRASCRRVRPRASRRHRPPVRVRSATAFFYKFLLCTTIAEEIVFDNAPFELPCRFRILAQSPLGARTQDIDNYVACQFLPYEDRSGVGEDTLELILPKQIQLVSRARVWASVGITITITTVGRGPMWLTIIPQRLSTFLLLLYFADVRSALLRLSSAATPHCAHCQRPSTMAPTASRLTLRRTLPM